MLRLIFVCFLVLSCTISRADIGEDTSAVVEPYEHSMNRAALFSAVIPGSGQIYNEIGYRKFSGKKHRAWWKVPIIYGGLAATGYYFYQNNKFANLAKQEYQFRENNPGGGILDMRFAEYTTQESLIGGYSDNNGTKIKGFDGYARNRDLLIFGFVGIWAINVLESYVDAHFVSFDASDDLSFSLHPTLLRGNNLGMSLQFNFN